MTGLEKIMGRILADAQAQADEILAKAEESAASVRRGYEQKALAEKTERMAATERESAAALERARSSVAVMQENAQLRVRSELLDEVYARVAAEIRAFPTDQYVSLLGKLLTDAVTEQLRMEEESRELYGEEEAHAPAVYEVLLNAHDRSLCGEALLADFRRRAEGKIPPEAVEKVRLAEDTPQIDGGLILRTGEVESNCTLGVMMQELRAATEAKMLKTLFP